jgi:hypothetical protein
MLKFYWPLSLEYEIKAQGTWEFVIYTSLLWLYLINPSEPSGHYMYRQLALSNSPFCSHSIFIVCIWERTVTISLHSINWLVFITECVYCAVRTGHLNTFQVILIFKTLSFLYYYYQKDERVKSGNILIDWCSLSPPPSWVGTLSVSPPLSLSLYSLKCYVIPLVFNPVSPVSIIPPTLHPLLRLHVALTRRTKGKACEPPQK